MRTRILTLFFILCGLNVSGQNLSGVVESSEGKVVEFATVMLTNAADSTQFIGTSTDDKGYFEFVDISYESFYVTVTGIGIKTTRSDVLTKSFNDTLKISIEEDANDLNEFNVESVVNKVEFEPGMITLIVENTSLSVGNTAIDLLRRVPGVFVDNDGNITVKGKRGINLYVDGRPTYLSGEQLKNFLKTLSATNISKIEVITQPGAKYDAEGNAGIINIVLKKKMALGFNGTVEGWYGQGFYPKGGGSFNFNYGKGKWNINGSYSFNHWHGYIWPESERNIDSSTYSQNYWGQPIDNNHSIRFAVDYEINEKWSIGTGINFNLTHGNWLGKTRSIFTNPSTSVVDSMQFVDDSTSWTNYNGSLNLNTQWKIDSLGQKFSVNVDGGIFVDNTIGNYQFRFLDQWGGVLRTSPDRNYTNSPFLYLVSGKVDYENPHLFKILEFEAGLKASYVNNDGDVAYTTFDGSNNVIPIPQMTNHFIYEENINAAYLSLKYKIKKWSFKAGLRGEHTNVTGTSITTGQVNRQNYFSLFPNAGINFAPHYNHRLSLTYSRRIDRPEYGQLNPFIYQLDNFSSYQGNPNLVPEFSHNFEFDYTLFSALTLNTTYTLITNNITDIFRVDSTNAQHIIYTNTNLGETHNFTAGGSFMMPVGKWMFMMLNGNAIYNSVTDSTLNINRSGWYGMFSGYFEFYLPANITIELNGWATTTQPAGQQIVLPMGGVSAGISTKLFKKSLVLKFNVNDIFRTTQYRTTTFLENGESYNSTFWWDSRVFRFSASFNFGRTLKKTKRKDKDAIFDRVGGGGR